MDEGMEVIEINCFDDFHKEIRPFSGKGFMFRGQNEDYSLLPSIGRYRRKGIHALKNGEDFKKVEMISFQKFQSESIPYISFQPKNEWEYLALAQHHGLPTRFLDWTFRPLLGLFFSVNNPDKYDRNGVVYLIQHTINIELMFREVLHETHMPSPFQPDLIIDGIRRAKEVSEFIERNEGDLVSYIPPCLSPKITAQDPILTLFLNPFEITKMPKKKYIITLKAKYSIRDILRDYGVEWKRVFPGIDGIAKSIKTLKYEMIYPELKNPLDESI